MKATPSLYAARITIPLPFAISMRKVLAHATLRGLLRTLDIIYASHHLFYFQFTWNPTRNFLGVKPLPLSALGSLEITSGNRELKTSLLISGDFGARQQSFAGPNFQNCLACLKFYLSLCVLNIQYFYSSNNYRNSSSFASTIF